MTKEQAREATTSELCRLLLRELRIVPSRDAELAALELTTRAAAWDVTKERMIHGNERRSAG